MCSSEARDLRDVNVYKMMEHLGIELGGGVIPRFGLMYASAVRSCEKCRSVHACTEWLETASSTSFAPKFCPNAGIFFELVFEGQTVPHTTTAD
jgi:Family of unknown function (DUF6455)